MKKIIKKLEKQLQKLRDLIQKREDYVGERSEKWQESKKCKKWVDKTIDIESRADELDTLIEEFKELK